MSTHLKTARILADLLDNRFEFLGFRFGLDPIIGLIPFVGDFVSFFLSAYIIWIAHQVGVSHKSIIHMWRNVFIDFILGLIPFIGDISDLFYKANQKNLALLEAHIISSAKVVEGEIVV